MTQRLLSEQEVAAYHDQGFLVVDSLIPEAILADIERDLGGLLDGARERSSSDTVFDLEDSHTPAEPRVRRIKQPHLHCGIIDALLRNPLISDIVAQLVGPNVRFQGTKLNFKSAAFGAPVDWHQDWAFYPHTNDDILAVGVMLDAMTPDNGPLMVLPGSHKGPAYDHHNGDVFCGAMDMAACGFDVADALPVLGPRGSISLHHVKTVHGSSLNTSGADRRLLLFEMMAADAWPLIGAPHRYEGLDDFRSRIVVGDQTLEPRLEPVPVRIPLPRPADAGSIYDVQKNMARRQFATYEESAAAAE